MKLAVAYARVSSKKQEDTGFSIPAQIQLFNTYSERVNLKIVKIFEENKTGGKVGRKVYNEMLAYLKEHNIKDVLVEKTDRIYRNFKDYVVSTKNSHKSVFNQQCHTKIFNKVGIADSKTCKRQVKKEYKQ